MNKIKRAERIAVMAQILSDSPNKIFTLSYFCDLFQTAKSTVSEDTAILAGACRHFGTGVVETVTGAAGGVRYRPCVTPDDAHKFLTGVCETLSAPSRVLPGGYLYFSDILSDPDSVSTMGRIIAGRYYEKNVDFVLTMETKGIPVALEVAKVLHVPLVIARHSTKVYEGSAVNISYVSGSGKIESMALSRRAVKEGQRALIVDDFTRGGGTSRGMREMMKEFNVEVMAVCYVLALREQVSRFDDNECTLMVMNALSMTDSRAEVEPADWIKNA